MAPKPLLLFLAILLLATAMFFTPAAAVELQAEAAKEQLTAKQMGETEAGVGEEKKVCYYIRGRRVCHPPTAQAETHSVEEDKRVCYYVMGHRVCHPPAP